MKMMDKDKDGYITYVEFTTSGHYDHEAEKKKKKK